MADTAIAIATPDLAIIEGQVTTTSQQVAQHFGKRHADVIRAIRSLDAPAEFTERNFALSEFTDSSGRKLPAYRITRDGFTLLAMGFTGKEAMQWKIAYLNAFNQMEAQLTGSQPLPNLYKQNPGDKLNSYQQQQLRGLLEEFVKHLPKDKQAGFMMQGWSKLKSHFGVAYREIPCERFDEAVSLLTRHVVEHAKPQPIEAQPGRIRVSPQTLIENAAHIAGQLFGEALKQGALGGSPIDRFVVTADYKGGRCNMEVIERDAYILPIPRLAEVIRSHEPIALSEVAALMGACAEKLARHHAPRLAA